MRRVTQDLDRHRWAWLPDARFFLLIVLIGFLCSGLQAQTGQATVPEASSAKANPAPARSGNGIVAMVMGKAIPFSDVSRQIEDLKAKFPEESESNLFWFSRKNMATRILLAQTAEQYAENVDNEEIINYYTQLLEQDYKTVTENIEEFRRDYLINHYLDGRMGRSERLKGISPDYADHIRITPLELRNAYQYYLKNFNASARVTLAQYLFPQSAFPDAAQLERAVQQCRELLQGLPSEPDTMLKERDWLKEAAKTWKGVSFRILTPSPDGKSLLQEIQDFIASASPGEVSPMIRLEKGVVIEYLIDKVVEEPMTFPAFQQDNTSLLMQDKRNRIQDAIVRELIQTAEYSPPDLFVPGVGSQRRP